MAQHSVEDTPHSSATACPSAPMTDTGAVMDTSAVTTHSPAGTGPHQGRDRTGAAPIGAGNGSLGQEICLPQCAVPYPNVG